MKLESLLAEAAGDSSRERETFALLNLGIIEGLDHGSMSVTNAVRSFYNADNCLYVRRRMKGKLPDRIMSHGVQLPDLFDALPADEAHREFKRELATMRTLCLQLLESRVLAAP
jgi:hypothetical protein